MKSDMRALLKIFAWSFALAVVVLGVGFAAALGWMTKESAPYWMLGILLAGVVAIRLWLGPKLLRPVPPQVRRAKRDPAGDPDDAR